MKLITIALLIALAAPIHAQTAEAPSRALTPAEKAKRLAVRQAKLREAERKAEAILQREMDKWAAWEAMPPQQREAITAQRRAAFLATRVQVPRKRPPRPAKVVPKRVPRDRKKTIPEGAVKVVTELPAIEVPGPFEIGIRFYWENPHGHTMKQMLKDIEQARTEGDADTYKTLTERYTIWAEKYLRRDQKPPLIGNPGR